MLLLAVAANVDMDVDVGVGADVDVDVQLHYLMTTTSFSHACGSRLWGEGMQFSLVSFGCVHCSHALCILQCMLYIPQPPGAFTKTARGFALQQLCTHSCSDAFTRSPTVNRFRETRAPQESPKPEPSPPSATTTPTPLDNPAASSSETLTTSADTAVQEVWVTAWAPIEAAMGVQAPDPKGANSKKSRTGGSGSNSTRQRPVLFLQVCASGLIHSHLLCKYRQKN